MEAATGIRGQCTQHRYTLTDRCIGLHTSGHLTGSALATAEAMAATMAATMAADTVDHMVADTMAETVVDITADIITIITKRKIARSIVPLGNARQGFLAELVFNDLDDVRIIASASDPLSCYCPVRD